MVTYNDGTSSHLPAPKRLITTHDEDGKAIFHTSDLEEVKLKYASPAAMYVHYTTHEFPVQFAGEKDLTSFLNPSGPETISNKNGTVVRMVDLEPDAQSPMHRTQSLDYGVVLEGEVELVLEDWDGPVRLMRRGDVSVQRGTMHAWRNASKDNWVRMLYVLVTSEPLEIGGKRLAEDYGGIELPK
jgi:quercetin dioxygenase-like cupin family protein